MVLSAPHTFPLLFILLMSGPSACDKPDRTDGYSHIGTAVFRRSYAGHENWTTSQLDSVSRADPEYMSGDAHGDSMLMILNNMSIAAGERLLLGENERHLTDTIVIANQGSEPDTAYIEKDTIDWQMALCFKSLRTTSRLPIEHVSSSFVAYLLPNRTDDQPFIAVLQQYYIMNGDNYEVAVYQKTGSRSSEK